LINSHPSVVPTRKIGLVFGWSQSKNPDLKKARGRSRSVAGPPVLPVGDLEAEHSQQVRQVVELAGEGLGIDRPIVSCGKLVAPIDGRFLTEKPTVFFGFENSADALELNVLVVLKLIAVWIDHFKFGRFVV